MPRYTLLVNGRRQAVDAEEDTPLLWVLRDNLELTGTKFGCGVGQCGACTVQLGGTPVRSCTLPVSAVGSRPITTIEGLAASPVGRRLQRAWIEHQVAQCGYCQSGQLLAAAALLARGEGAKAPSDAQIDQAMSNICRCGTYPRIRAAIRDAARAAGTTAAAGGSEP
ncbi:MAG TPA: (2Fe-2S)-binding protein [Longimicrobiales bacterium]